MRFFSKFGEDPQTSPAAAQAANHRSPGLANVRITRRKAKVTHFCSFSDQFLNAQPVSSRVPREAVEDR
jgi:hypothetical protein